MVYKRYIKKKRKVYGPYIYESKRIGNKVVSTYVGEPKKLNKKRFKKFIPLVLVFGLVFLSFLFVFFLQYPITGKFTLQISPSYLPGENITGLFKIGIKKGELIPIDSKIIIEQQGNIKEIPLSQVVNSNSEGGFYVENTEISGDGQGYGFFGEKIIYPNVFFKLNIYSETEKGVEEPSIEEPRATEPEEQEQPIEPTQEPEQTTELVEEPKEEQLTGPTQEPEQTTESPGSLITGFVIQELEQEIKASCSKDNPFIYEIEQGKTAEIKQGSLEIEIIEDNEVKRIEVPDNAVSLHIVDNKAEVTTDYFILEKGFGADFLQDEENYLEINLENLDIKAEQGVLKISLVYQDKVLAEKTEEINVEQPQDKIIDLEDIFIEKNLTLANETISNITEINLTFTNLTLIKNIPDIIIQKSYDYRLDLNEYFMNAEDYSISGIENLTVNLQENILIITPDFNFTGQRQAKITAFKENNTIESNLFNIIVSETNITIQTTQEQAVIGKPVKWKKQVLLEFPEEVIIKLPAEAQNISVKKIIKEKDKRIKENKTNEEVGEVKELEQTEELEEDVGFSILTGKAISELELEEKGIITKAWESLIKNIKTITGFVIGNQSLNGVEGGSNEFDEIEILLNENTTENTTEYEISYETSAPESFEQEIEKGKRIIISAPDDLGYKDVLAFTELPVEANSSVIKLYYLVDGIKEDVEFNAFDKNNNSLIDYIEWVVPHLSNQTYELEINIINIKSYPQVGNNWTVIFNTTGKANLTITAFNKTTWSDTNEDNDLKFIEVRCGENVFEYKWIDNGSENSSVFIKDYECNETSFEISKVLTTGFHSLEFNFGGIKAYAYNTAGTLNLKIYGAINVNYNTSVNLKVVDQATVGFDAYDMEIINPPNNYSEFYSNITSGTEYHLVVDAWNDTSNPRTLYLIYNFDATAGAKTGVIDFKWNSFSETNFTGNFTYYSNNSNYTIPVASIDMRSNDSYKADITSQSKLFVRVIIQEYSEPNHYINFTAPTPLSGTTTTNTSFEVNVSITEPSVSEIKYNWDGTNYTIFNNQLMVMFNFENLSALGESAAKAFDIAGGDNNATLSSPIVNLTGRYGKGLEFDGTETIRASIPDSNNLDLTNFTISFWFKRKGKGCDNTCSFGGCFSDIVEVITAKGGGGGDGGTIDANWIIGSNSNNLVFCAESNSPIAGSDYSLGGSTIINNNTWTHGAVTYSGATVTLYLNGVYENSGSPAGTIHTNVVNVGIGVGLEGLTSTANGAWNGTIDEFMIWNRSLSVAEINQLYMSSLQKYNATQWYLYVNQTKNATAGLDVGTYTYFASAKDAAGTENITETRSITIQGPSVDNPPTVTLNYPTNSQSLSSMSITFNCTAIDGVNLTNVTLYGNWSEWHANETNSSGINGAYLFIKNISDASYLWNCRACDNLSNCSFASSNYTFTIDTNFPQINFTAPTPESGTTTLNTSIIINVSVTESSLEEFNYNWNGTNYTIFNDTLRLWFNFDNLSALGECDTWYCNISDLSSYNNYGQLRNDSGNDAFGNSIDESRLPIWVSDGRYGGAMFFNVTSSDTLGSSIFVAEDDSLDPGSEDFAMMLWFKCNYCTDCDIARKGSTNTHAGGGWYKMEIAGYGTANLLSLQFNTDGADDATIEYDTPVCDGNWHFTIGQRVGSAAELWLDGQNITSGDWVAGQADSSLSGSISNPANLTVGSKDTQNDDFFNGTMDEFRIYIGRHFTKEEIEIMYMSNLQKYDTNKYYFYVNQTKNATNVLEDSVYTYFASAKDSSGNENITETRNVTIDSIIPTINILLPTNTTYTTTTVHFNVSLNEAGSWCGFSLDGNTNITMTANASNTGFNFTNTTMTQGSHNVSFACNDTAGNMNSSSGFVYFTVDTTQQIGLSVIYPTTNINVTQNEFFNVTLNVSCIAGSCGVINVSLDPTITTPESSIYTGSILNNVTAETGKSNFTHLNISNIAPYDSLVGYWNFDELAQSSWDNKTVYDFSSNNRDGALEGTAVVNSNGCIFGNCMQLDGINVVQDAKLDLENKWTQSGTDNMVLMAWVRPNNDPSEQRVITSANECLLRFNAATLEFILNSFTNPDRVVSASKKSLTNWQHVVGRYDKATNNMSLFYNGVHVNSSIPSGTYGTCATWNIGAQTGASSGNFNGSIDEVMVFNGTLTDAQILAIYNNQSSRFFAKGTQDIPNINVSGDNTENKVNVTLKECGTLFNSNLSGQIGIADGTGTYNYNGSIINFSSCIANSLTVEGNPNNVSLRIGFNAGDYQFYSPLVISNITLDSWNEAGAGDTKSGLISTIAGTTPFYTNASTNPLNTSSLSAGQNETIIFWVNATGSIGTTYEFFAYANLTSNLSISNITSKWNVTIVGLDTTPPTINIILPTNTTYPTTTVHFNVSLNEAGSWCGLSLDGAANISMTANASNTGFGFINSTMTQGSHNVSFACNDTIGNMNSSSGTRVFTVDTTYPLVKIVYPANNTNTSDTGIDVNYTRSDTNLASCWYSNDSWAVNTSLGTGGVCTNITTVTWSEGQHNVKIWVNDTAGNVNSSSVRFTVDTTYPLISITSPTSKTYTDLSAVTTYFNLSSNEVLSSCKFTINNWVTNYTMGLNSSLTGADFTNSSMSDGSHTAIFWCNDTAGNINNSEQVTFTTNVIPSVSLSSPATGNITTNRTPTFTWVGTDNGGGPSALQYEINITCWSLGSIMTSGSVYKDNSTILSNTSYIPSPYLKCLSDNNQYYNWSVRAYDGMNYSAWATERNISIQSEITISLPVNSVDFGSMSNLESNDTTDNAPPPLVLRNDGNAELNITINFTNLWNSIINPNKYFQFKIRNLTDSCFNYANTTTSWTNATAPGITGSVIQRLNFTSGYQTGCNNASIDINVTVPSGEGISSASEPRSSIITFISSLGEPKVT